jgi:hypothetical protein
MTLRDIERVLYFESYVVIEGGHDATWNVPDPDRRDSIWTRWKSSVTNSTRRWVPKGIQALLKSMDLDARCESCARAERNQLRAKIKKN